MKHNKRWSNDKMTTNGTIIDSMTSQNRPRQILKEPIHISGSHIYCIDFIFTSQPNLSVDSGTHPSFHENCHHQIIYSKSDLKIFYSSLYEITIWYYKYTDTYLIKKTINNFDWKRAFESCDPNMQVNIFIDTVFNIMSNLIPNETLKKVSRF